jgi:hypothetical protein
MSIQHTWFDVPRQRWKLCIESKTEHVEHFACLQKCVEGFVKLKAACSAAEWQHQSVEAAYMLALVCAGLLFQLPGLLLAGGCGIGAANFLKNPAPWLRCVTSGGEFTHTPLLILAASQR